MDSPKSETPLRYFNSLGRYELLTLDSRGRADLLRYAAEKNIPVVRILILRYSSLRMLIDHRVQLRRSLGPKMVSVLTHLQLDSIFRSFVNNFSIPSKNLLTF